MKNHYKSIFVIIMIIISMLLGVGLVYFYKKNNISIPEKKDKSSSYISQQLVKEESSYIPGVKPENNNEELSISNSDELKESVKVDEKLINKVLWYKSFAATSQEMILNKEVVKACKEIQKDMCALSDIEVHRRGKILEGPYKNGEVFSVLAGGHRFSNRPFYVYILKFLVFDGKTILLKQYSDYNGNKAIINFWEKFYEIDDSIYIPDLNYPQEFNIPGFSEKLTRNGAEISGYKEDIFCGEFFSNQLVKNIIYPCLNNNYCEIYTFPESNQNFLVKMADGECAEYRFNFSFFETVNASPLYSIGKFNITSEDNSLSGYHKVWPFIYKEDEVVEMKKIDTNYGGYNFFDGRLASSSAAKLVGNPKSVIFWKGPFNGYILFSEYKYPQRDEMLWGKPVIYLYPKKTTNVSVQVKPAGGLTISDPEYGEGWQVQAKPNGEIFNYADGKNYPYLFWEGKSQNYDIGNQGALVEKENVKNFLQESLEKQGLVKKEIDEFMDFWLPRMQAKDYYQIYFFPKNEIDRMAPLSIEPSPDKIIRVLMDYRGVDEPIETVPQNFTRPAREGFTVVEWGGILH